MTTLRELFRTAVRQHQSGQFSAAEQAYLQILQQNPRHAQSLHLLGVVELQTGRLADARNHIEQAIQVGPATAAFYGNLGTVCVSLKKPAEAIVAYERAIELDASFVDAHYNLANTLRELSRFEEAESAFKRAIELQPDHAGSLNNYGTLLRECNRSREAVAILQAATTNHPQSVESFYNLGNANRDVGEVHHAIDAFRQADSLRPETPRILAALAMANLYQGNLTDGWLGYEYRMQCEGGAISPACQPVWDGQSLDGRTIMLFAEQGFGDTLQFVRFAQQLKQQGATVLLECQAPLQTLLKSCPFLDEVFPRGAALPVFDVAAPLLSLPRLLGCNSFEMLGNDNAYLFADQKLVEEWRSRIAGLDGLKIGIAWQGAKDHLNDCRRSFGLHEFLPLYSDAVTFVSLQKGFGREQIDDPDSRISVMEFPDLDNGDAAFLDSAALMQSLDLVISSDTSIAHLAGALGIPVWVGLSTAADWRWFESGEQSPWYSTMRLFRQTDPGNWSTVFADMAAALPEQFKQIQSTGESSRITVAGASGGSHPMPAETVRVAISPGELFDKITILEIKFAQINDEQKRANVKLELDELRAAAAQANLIDKPELQPLIDELKHVNTTLWQVEDDIRACEAANDFGPQFIELARAVYKTNDQRSQLKRQINVQLGSRLIEEKSYSDYTSTD